MIQKKDKFAMIFLGLITILMMLNIVDVSGQADIQTFQIHEYYQFTEHSENIDTIHVNQTINIPFLSDRWTITDLQFNFSDIKLEREVEVIEDNPISTEDISYGTSAYGVEINITEETVLYGVDIYGAPFGENPKTGTEYELQIQGFSSGTNTPNGTILAHTELNRSSTYSWCNHIFPTGVNLTTGQYYLVINATYSSPSDKSAFIWSFNDDSPSYPDLYRSKYDGGWTAGEQNKVFLHKLIQKVNRSYNPEEINLTAVINEVPYIISNGTIEGTGVLNISDINLDLISSDINIPVENNISAEMEFDLEFKINLVNQFYSDAQMIVQQGTAIEWSITPDIERTPSKYNYSIEFNFPNSWYNVEILRNSVDVSSQTEIDETNNYLQISNDTVLSGASWEIIANSPNFASSFTIQRQTYEPEQILEFSITSPHQSGNLTFFFVDSAGFEKYNESRAVGVENLFSYEIPHNPLEGSYYAIIYWNNLTDAGFAIQEYNIIIPFNLTTVELILIIAGSVSVPTIAVVSISAVKSSRRKKEAMKQKIFNKYQDVMNLDHIIIADKDSGLDIYDESISGKGMSATLITGFLEAIRSFGIELTNSEKESQTIKLEYQNSKILMSEIKNLRTTLIMTETPSQDFVESVKSLSEEIEEKFHSHLENFKGNTTMFKNLNYFISKHLNTGLIYPLKLNLTRKTRLTSIQKSVVSKVRSIMKQNNSDYFYVSQLFSEKKGFQTGWGVSILKLIDKGIFFQKK